MRRWGPGAIFAFAAMSTSAGAQDVASGEKVFKKSLSCHAVGEGAKNKIGPVLNGIVDRPAGQVDEGPGAAIRSRNSLKPAALSASRRKGSSMTMRSQTAWIGGGRQALLAGARCAVILALSVVGATAALAQNTPEAFAPLPDAPKINEARARLGAMLFFDARLSGDTSHSCATCHDPAKGWGTGEPLSHGYTSVLYFRNAPGLFNAASRNFYMWDGRLDGSDQGTLVRDMMTEAHTMNVDSRIAQERLKQVPEYVALFEEAFGGDPYGGKMYGAIGEFLKTIRTVNAPFDLFLRGSTSALSAEAKQGMALFAGKAGCTQCHSGPMLSDGALHALGVPDHPDLLGTGGGAASAGHAGMASSNDTAERQIAMLRHFATMGTPNYMNLRGDVGHYVVTKDESDIGKFATPSLWDVGQTAPYMHSGVFASLEDVVEFYNGGGGEGANRSKLLRPLGLIKEEKAALVAFLNSLTGDPPAVAVPDLPEYQLREVGKN